MLLRPLLLSSLLRPPSLLHASLSTRTITLPSGAPHPPLGFGTYKLGVIPASAAGAAASTASPGDAQAVVATALKAGYRFLDCAQFYANEPAVGRAIAGSGVSRGELFLASKVWTDTVERGPDAVRAQVRKCLRDLQTDYLDLVCVHWPVPGLHVAAYQALQELHAAGLVRDLGVSNYAVEDYEELVGDGGTTVPVAVNQIEINPFLYRRETIE